MATHRRERALARIPTLTGAALVVVAAACGADEGSYLKQNERILEMLPEATGAERLEVEHNPYYEDWGGPPIGWTTNVIYRAPPEMTDQDVISFYLENMPDGWQPKGEEVPIIEAGTGERKGRVLLVGFTQGTAVGGVNTDNMHEGAPHTFEVSIDHRGAR